MGEVKFRDGKKWEKDGTWYPPGGVEVYGVRGTGRSRMDVQAQDHVFFGGEGNFRCVALIIRALGRGGKVCCRGIKELAREGKGKKIMQRLMVDCSRSKGVEEWEKVVEVVTYVRNNLDWIENIGKVKGY